VHGCVEISSVIEFLSCPTGVGQAGVTFFFQEKKVTKRALTREYPDITLSYPQALISKGSLAGKQSAKVAKKPNNILHFSFADNSGVAITVRNDTVILVAYAPDLQQAVFGL